jgi:hypothetical protein
VARVELDIKTEMEQNIFLNNSSSQGEFDRELIMQIIPEIDILKAGFTEIELNNIGIEFDLEKHQDENVDDIINQFDIINAENKQRALESHSNNENHQDWKKIKKGIAQKENKRRENTDSYIVLTFTDHQGKASFCRRFGFEEDIQYIKGEMIEKFIRGA